MQRFKSTAHPGSAPLAYVYGRAISGPLAGFMLPVMIATLVAMLEGRRVLPGSLVASGGALVLASAWAHFQLRREPAELHVRGSQAAVLTIWEVLRGRSASAWAPVFDLRARDNGLFVTIGYENYSLDYTDWPRYDELVRALKTAKHNLRPEVPHDV